MHIKAEDVYKDIVDDAKGRFDTSNYSKDDRPLPIGKKRN